MSESPPNDPTTDETRTGRETADTRAATNRDARKWISAIAALVGLWIAASPVIYETTEAAMWNNVLIGAAIFLLAGYNYYRIANAEPTSIAAMALVALLGLWILVSPFVLDVESEALQWSNVVSGLVTAILAGYVAYAGREVRARTPAGTRT